MTMTHTELELRNRLDAVTTSKVSRSCPDTQAEYFILSNITRVGKLPEYVRLKTK